MKSVGRKGQEVLDITLRCLVGAVLMGLMTWGGVVWLKSFPPNGPVGSANHRASVNRFYPLKFLYEKKGD